MHIQYINTLKKLFVLITILANVSCSSSPQENSPIDIQNDASGNYTTEVIVPELEVPWGMAFLPDGSILVSERKGTLIKFKDGIKTTVTGLPEIYVHGQGGLLDLELHPDYANNGWIYFAYGSAEGSIDQGGNTAIMRAKLAGDQLVEKQLLYKAVPNTKNWVHWGCRLEFDNEGYLYFSIGDRQDRDLNPQNITLDAGKIYRIHDDGRIPEDNPFVNKADAKKAIFSYGHRNPQGMTKHPETGEIWITEHGPKGGDEINIIKSGKNYGWPVVTYGINYDGSIITENQSLPGMEEPLYYWTPSIAPSGMCFVTSDKYPEWKGSLLVCSLVFQYLERLQIENNKVISREKLFDKIGRLRNVRQAPDGYIYIGVEGKGILRIIPSNE